MIELLIERRTRQPIVAKPLGSYWTPRELDGPNLCVVKLSDPPAELAKLFDDCNVISNPFAEWTRDWLTNLPVIVHQSTVQLKSADIQQGKVVKFASMEASTIG